MTEPTLYVFHRSQSGAAAYAAFVAERRQDVVRTEIGADCVRVWTHPVVEADGTEVLVTGWH